MSASIDVFLCGGMIVCFMLSSMRKGTLKGGAIAKCSMLSAQFCQNHDKTAQTTLERRKVDRFERRKVDRLERRKVTRRET